MLCHTKVEESITEIEDIDGFFEEMETNELELNDLFESYKFLKLSSMSHNDKVKLEDRILGMVYKYIPGSGDDYDHSFSFTLKRTPATVKIEEMDYTSMWLK